MPIARSTVAAGVHDDGRREPGEHAIHARPGGLLGLVAVYALIFRGYLAHHGVYAVRLVHRSGEPVVDEALIRGERRGAFDPHPPGATVEMTVRFPDPAQDSLSIRAHGFEGSIQIRLDPIRFGLGPASPGFEIRVTPNGHRLSLHTTTGQGL